MPDNPKVFMLEDDLNLVRGMQVMMEREGWHFQTQDNTAKAGDAIRQMQPDIILLDVELPDGSGYDVCRQISADSSLNKIPVIFLTGKGDVESRLKGFSSGGKDYVSKPFAAEELMARMRAHLSIKKQYDSLNQKIQELSLVERVHQDLVDMIVHDLKAPLGTIEVTLEMLHDSGMITDADYVRIVRNARSAAEFALCMVSDILDVGKGHLKAEARAFDAKALAERLQSMFATQLAHQKIQWVPEIQAPPAGFQTDSALLFRILMNLTSNAVKFSRAGHRITLRMTPSSKGFQVEIADQGPGIPDSEKEKIFTKYYRGTMTGANLVPGSGLGLAFCKLAADTLRGTIRVENNPGGGSRFILELSSLPS